MGLLNQSVQVAGQLGKFFETIRSGQAPGNFNRQLLKDWGFKSSNHLAFIPLLKGLGFLAPDGTPTQRYRDFLDQTKWRQILAEAVKDAYGDIFVIKNRPTKADRKVIAGKYKSTYNLSENAADRAAGTFLALLELADENALYANAKTEQPGADAAPQKGAEESSLTSHPDRPERQTKYPMGLQYNIQIHLPATKDIEVYNSIFRSLREHLID